MRKHILAVAGIFAIALAAALGALSAAVFASPGACSGSHTAGSTNLTAWCVVSNSHQKITAMTINATGYDIGIYVAPGVMDIQINGVTVTGANQHGIFVQDASLVTIEKNLVTGNGINTRVCPPTGTFPGCIPENKAIELVGTSNSVVSSNVVSNNSGDGGIGIADDGLQNPGAPLGVAGASLKGKNNIVKGNLVVDNSRGCGIVVAAYNAGVGVENNQVVGNTIIGQAPSAGQLFPPPGSYIGQIVVAADGPNTSVFNTQVTDNSLDGSELPGIVVHSNVFGDKITGTIIRQNIIAENGYYPGLPAPAPNDPGISQGTTGIALIAEVGVQPPNTTSPVLSRTILDSNIIMGDTIGVWLCGTDHTFVNNLQGNPTKVTCNAGGS